MSRHETHDESPSRQVVVSWKRCPVCDGGVQQTKCKLICSRCHAIIENCSGD